MPRVTTKGIEIDSTQDIKGRLEQSYRAIDPGWPLDPSSPDGQKLVIDTETWSELNQLFQSVYHALDPDRAARSALIGIGRICGITPQDATPSTAIVECVGLLNTVIPKGSLIRSTDDGTLWETDSTITIGKIAVDVGVTCTIAGSIEASTGSLSEIVDVIGGWTSVTNKAAASSGFNEESTKDFRIRRRKSVALPASNQMDSLYAKIANTENVQFVTVYENYETAVDSDGLHGHSIAIYVEGGTNEDVAKSIAADNNVGTGMNRITPLAGTKITMNTLTPKGRETSVTFFRPVHVDVFIEIEVLGGDSQSSDLIRDAIILYSKGYLMDESVSGFDKTGFEIGESVAPGLLYTPCNQVLAGNGVVTSIKIGKKSGSLTTSPLSILFTELAIFSKGNITVNRTNP